MAGSRFRLVGNGADDRGRFRLFGKRGRCAISLISETVAGARFHFPGIRAIGRGVRLAGKRGKCAISLISEIADYARFQLAGNGTIGMETIPLIRKTWHVRDFANFGNLGRFAISLDRKRNRWSVGDFAYSENALRARFR